MEFHELANLFPLMDGKAFQELVADISENGLMEPITTYQNKILDGRNRYRACTEAGVKPRFIEFDGSVPVVNFIVSLNLHRRHLSESQRGMVGAEIAKMQNHRPISRSNDPLISQPEAAEMLNVSVPTIKRATVVMKHGTEELKEAVVQGNLAVTAAAKIARLPHEEQREILSKPKIVPARPKTEKFKYDPSQDLPPGHQEVTEAWGYTATAISHMERIRADDPRRIEQLRRMRDWCNEQLKKAGAE